jgi:hypothetical protein
MYKLLGATNAEWLAHGLGLAEAGSADNLGAGYCAVLAALGAPVACAVAALVHLAKPRL